VLILDAAPQPCIVPGEGYTLRTSQWALLERAQRSEDVVALIICCDRPLIPEPREWTARAVSGAACEQNPEVLRIIDSLLQWLAVSFGDTQRRSAQLFCGLLPREYFLRIRFHKVDRWQSLEFPHRDS